MTGTLAAKWDGKAESMFILSLTRLSVYVLKQIDFTSQKEKPCAKNVYRPIIVCLTLTLCCLTDGSHTFRNLLPTSPGYKNVPIYQTIRRHTPEVRYLDVQRYENL